MSKIIAIFNQYKDIFDNLINNSDVKSLNRLKLINQEPHNISRSKNILMKVKPKLKNDYLIKNLLDKLL